MSEPNFNLDIRGDFAKIKDPDRYVIWVLWVIGFSAASIASVTGLPRKRVLNACNHSPFANRAGMTDAERQGHLSDLRAIRFEDGLSIDGGRFDRIDWRVLPLADGRKRRPARAT